MDKNPPANAGDTGSIPHPGRIHVLQSNQVHRPQLLKPVRLEPGIHSQRSHRPPALRGGGGSSLRHPNIAVGVGPLRDPQHRSGGRSSPTRHPSITVGVGPPQQDSPALQWGWVLPETPQHHSGGRPSPRTPSITVGVGSPQ